MPNNALFTEKIFNILDEYTAPLQPGEVLPVRILLFSEGEVPALARAVLTVTIIDSDSNNSQSTGSPSLLYGKVTSQVIQGLKFIFVHRMSEQRQLVLS